MPVNVRNLNADTAGRPRVRKDAGVDGSRNPRRRPGGRSARVQDAVAQAALTQLLDVGYQGLTIRGVAQAAGVAETTVYRRWPTINHLTAAALLKLEPYERIVMLMAVGYPDPTGLVPHSEKKSVEEMLSWM